MPITNQIDLLIANKEGMALKGGTDVQISFNTLAKKEALQIPKSAVMTDAQDPYVYAIENDKAVVKPITTGIALGDFVEVLTGLSAGEKVVSTGQINLKQGSAVSIIKN